MRSFRFQFEIQLLNLSRGRVVSADLLTSLNPFLQLVPTTRCPNEFNPPKKYVASWKPFANGFLSIRKKHPAQTLNSRR